MIILSDKNNMKKAKVNAHTLENLSSGKFIYMSGADRGRFFSNNIKPHLPIGWRQTIRPKYSELKSFWRWRNDVNRRLDNLIRGSVYPEPDELALYSLHLLEVSEAFRVEHKDNFMDLADVTA